jgi:hypothetical protein
VFSQCPPREAITTSIYSPIAKVLFNCSELRILSSFVLLNHYCVLKTIISTNYIKYHTCFLFHKIHAISVYITPERRVSTQYCVQSEFSL